MQVESRLPLSIRESKLSNGFCLGRFARSGVCVGGDAPQNFSDLGKLRSLIVGVLNEHVAADLCEGLTVLLIDGLHNVLQLGWMSNARLWILGDALPCWLAAVCTRRRSKWLPPRCETGFVPPEWEASAKIRSPDFWLIARGVAWQNLDVSQISVLPKKHLSNQCLECTDGWCVLVARFLGQLHLRAIQRAPLDLDNTMASIGPPILVES
jgi:hypothetical protein